jgi:4-hydroxy-4-methyl-2-oxoglutarate aldolase
MVEKEIIQRLSRWYSGDIHDCLDKLGIWGAIEGLNLYGLLPESGRICGPATTVQFVPNRVKITSRRYHKAIDEVPKGGILIIDTAGAKGSCTGELMCTGAKKHGAIGTIVNGTIRDLEEINALGYPAFARGVLPVTAVGRMEDVGYNIDIEIDGIRIQPGDIIFADLDGVVVIPQDAAPIVADMADALGKLERNFKAEILAGKPLLEVFADV